MAKKSLTRDEQFLVKVFELAQKGEDLFTLIDRYQVGLAIGQNHRSVDNIVRMLAQTNFIKKEEDPWIYLTSLGISLAKELILCKR